MPTERDEEKGDMRAALAKISELHDAYDGPHTYCHECGGLTPCETKCLADGIEFPTKR